MDALYNIYILYSVIFRQRNEPIEERKDDAASSGEIGVAEQIHLSYDDTRNSLGDRVLLYTDLRHHNRV